MPTTPEQTDLEKPELPELHEQSEQSEPSAESASPKAAGGTDRRGIAVAAVLLLACAGLITYGVLDTGADKAGGKTAVPTAAVTYEVLGEGAADISYRGDGTDGRADVVKNAELPWKKTVNVPLGTSPIVNITLGEKGGEASCTLAVRGKHVQRSTASGAFGRSTCTAELPAPEPSAPAENSG